MGGHCAKFNELNFSLSLQVNLKTSKMIEQKVKSVLKNSLKSISKKENIDLRYLRIRIKLTEDHKSAYCTVFESNHQRSDLKWSTILGLATPFKNVVVDKIVGNLFRLSEELSVDKKSLNARYYAVNSSGEAGMIIYDGDKPLRKIEVNDVI